MKTIIKIIILLLVGLNAKSQSNPSGVPTQNSTGWFRHGFHQTDSGEIIAPRIPNFTPRFPGTTILYQQNGVDTSLHYWTGLRWIKINAQGIDTTSLSNRINLKLNISDTSGKWLSQSTRLVDTIYRVNDSTVGYTIKGNPYTFQILGRSSGGGSGSGTVTSVGLSMPSAFSVIGSPITSSGTFSVSGAGTSSQYIRGNGTLATTDTGMIPNYYLKVRGLLTGTSPITFNQFTGSIGINNANTTGTKGAASFTSAFSDNGAGQIDMADLVTSGSCTGCELNIDSKGRITAFATGAGGATNNTNIGSGFRPVNVITQEMRTYFSGFGMRLDSVANTNALTWSADTTRGTGLPTYFYVDSIAGVIYANNGLYKDADTIKWGQPISTVGNPAALTYNTEIPLNGFNSVFTGTGGLAIGTSTVGNRKLNIAATSTTQGINITTVDGTGINTVASGTGNALVAQTGGTGTAIGGYSNGSSGYGVLASSANNNAIPFKANNFSTLTNSATPVVAEFVRNVSGIPADGVGLSIMFRGQTTTTTDVETGQIRNYLSTALHGSRSSAFEFHLVNNAVSARKALLAASGQWTWDGYPSLTAQVDTTTYKPIAIDGSGNVVKMSGWTGGGASGITQLTGQVTAGPGSGSQTATIATNTVSNANLRQSVATSVIGRSANSTGDVADIQGTIAGTYLKRNATPGLVFDSVDYAEVKNTPSTNPGVYFSPAQSFDPSFVVFASAIVYPTNSFSHGTPITWGILDNATGHNSSFIDSAYGNAGNQRLALRYPLVKNVLNHTITPDESFAGQSLTIGATVGTNLSESPVYRGRSIGVRLTGNGSGTWTKSSSYAATFFDVTTFNTGDGGTSFNVSSPSVWGTDYDGLNIQYIGPNNYHIKRVYSGLGAYNVRFVLLDEFGNFVNTNPTTTDEIVITNAGMQNVQVGMATYIAGNNDFFASNFNWWVFATFECWMVAAPVSTTSIQVRWQPTIPSATNYKIYRATSLYGARTLVHTGTDGSFVDSGLSSGTLYWYFMIAVIAGVDTEITYFTTNTKN